VNPIRPPIKPGDNGDAVSNLRAALLFLLERGTVKALEPPNRPTADELKTLDQKIRSEQAGGKVFDGDTRQLVLYIQLQHGLGDGLGGAVDARTAGLLNQLLKKYGAFDAGAEFVVRGTVKDALGQPQAGLLVIALDRDLRRLQELGRAVTDPEGRFDIPYVRESFRDAEGVARPEVDLVLQVRRAPDDKGGPIHVHEEPKPVPAVANVDVVLPAAREPGLSEFERAILLIRPLLIGQGAPITDAPPLPTGGLRPIVVVPGRPGLTRAPVRYADLPPEEIAGDDLAFIVRETGLGNDAVWAWAESARWAQQALRLLEGDAEPRYAAAIKAPGWPFFYGVLRLRRASGLVALLRDTAQTWHAIQSAAAAAELVPALSDKDWAFLLAALRQLMAPVELDGALNPGDPLVALLQQTPMPLPRGLAGELLNIYRTEGLANPDAYLKLAEKVPGEAASVRLFVRTLRLNELAGGRSALVGEMGKRLDGTGDSIEMLAGLGAGDWMQVVDAARTNGLPLDESSKGSLAYGLQHGVERLHPAASLTARLGDGSVVLKDPELQGMAGMLDQHRKGADALLQGKGLDSPEVKAINDTKVVDTLLNLGRMGKLGLQFAGAAHLYDKGVKSAGRLVQHGPAQIRDMLLDRFPRDVVDAIVGNVQSTVDDLGRVVGNIVAISPGGRLTQDNPDPEPRAQPDPAPTLRGIFGDLDECLCRPCESVLGLPAYLVDLLILLRRTPATPAADGTARTALDVLRERRGDIPGTLQLSCENAGTEVLHIDEAIRVLEGEVRRRSQQQDVGATLAQAGYPWSLPFDPAATDLASCLEALGTSRPALMAHLSSPSQNDRVAAELGLSAAERALITRAVANDWWLHYGFAGAGSAAIDDPASNEALSDTPQALLQRASVLMVRSGLGLEELEAALATRFVGGLALSERDQCKASKMRLVPAGQPAHLDRLHRLVRLHRKLPGWSMAVLDSALVQLNASPLAPSALVIDDAVLAGVAEIQRIARTLKLAPEAVLGSRSLLSEVRVGSSSAESLFDRVYLGPAVRDPGRQRLHALRQAGASSVEPIERASDAIAAALGMDAREVVALAQAAGGTLSHASLSWYFRHHTLSRALGISIDQLRRLVATSGIDPFLLFAVGAPAPASAKADGFSWVSALVAARRRVGDSGLPFDFALALLRSDPQALPAGLRATPGLEQMLRDLRDSLGQVADGSDLFPDDAGALHASLSRMLRAAFESETVERLLDELQTPSGNPSAELIKALTATIPDGSVPVREALMTLREATALLTPDVAGGWNKYERYAFLHLRLHERFGDAERRVAQALETRLSPAQASVVLRALAHASPPPELVSEASKALATPGPEGRAWGADRAWFESPAQAERLLLAPLQPPTSVGSRYRDFVARVAALGREEILVQTVARWTGWPTDVAAAFLAERLTVEPTASGSPARRAGELLLDRAFWASAAPPAPHLLDWVRRLDRVAAFVSRATTPSSWLALTDVDWRLLVEVPAATSSSPTDIGESIRQWPGRGRLLDLAWLANPAHLSSDVLAEQSRALHVPNARPPAAMQPTAARAGTTGSELWELARILRLPAGAGTAPVALSDLRHAENLRALFESAIVARSLRATAAQFNDLAGADLDIAAATARQLLAARVGIEDWQATIGPIDDAIRGQRRDALIAWVLQDDARAASIATTRRRPWLQPGDLFQHLLIDFEVQPCMRSTPVALAVGSVQLFAQQVLFGVVKEVTDTEELRRLWSWMRSYRLWEANRKVFLFPENWLFPELRDDKSSSFKLLESALGRGELNQELASRAFGQFLDDVALVGRMHVLGLYEDVRWSGAPEAMDSERTARDLYVVGRLPNPPYRYFWRRCRAFGMRSMEWSPWKEIDIDIPGDHVLPLVLHNKLLLAWPLIEKSQPEGNDPARWRVDVAWSAQTGEHQWQPVQKSRWQADTGFEVAAFTDARSAFTFRGGVSPDGKRATVDVFATVNALPTTPSKPPTPDQGPAQPLQVPAAFYRRSEGVADLARFLAEGFSRIPAAYADMIECYCTRDRFVREQRVNLFYTHLDVFGDPTAVPRHKALIAADSGIRALVPNAATQQSKLPEFVQSFADYGDLVLYRTFVDAIRSASAARRICFRAWVRATLDGVPGLIELNPSRGSFSLEIRMAGGSTKRVTLMPTSGGGDPAWIDLRLGPLQQETCSVTWSLLPGSPAASEPLASVDEGKQIDQIVHFVIDASGATPQALGFDLGRRYGRVATLSIDGTGPANAVAGAHQALSVEVEGGQPWLNGFLEDEVPAPMESPAPANATGLVVATERPVFQASLPWTRYWAVGARGGDLGRSVPAIWHFSEGEASCFIDLQRVQPGSGMHIYPDAADLPKRTRASWRERSLLPEPAEQHDTFGAEGLPPLAPEHAQAVPSAVRSGTAAFDGRLSGACYNWEIFCHAPLLIADRLTKQHRFEDADRWLRLIFDPTRYSAQDPKAFLRLRVFRDSEERDSVTAALTSLAQAAAGRSTSGGTYAIQDLIERWRSTPFQPFAISRRRHSAFLLKVVFACLDNTISWADSLYRRETREAIGEATLLYVLASRILGPRPRVEEARRIRSAMTFDQLADRWDDFANAWVSASPTFERRRPMQYQTNHGGFMVESPPAPEGFLYFCMPLNDKLLGYWNQLEDRLFNIRHCRNIEGIERTLPIMAPPIDVELLVRATAAGLDLQSVVDGLYAPPPNYRFNVIAAKAAELASEARGLGASLLSAMEKRDAEELGQLRSTHELRLSRLVKEVKSLQVSEADGNLEALRSSRQVMVARQRHLGKLLGIKDVGTSAPGANGAEMPMLGDVASGLASADSRLGLIAQEVNQIDYTNEAYGWSLAAGVSKGVAGVLHMSAGIAQAAGGALAAEILKTTGTGVSTTAEMFELVSRGWQHGASREATLGAHVRRRDDWAFQFNQTIKELNQVDKQILANEIRLSLAKRERDNHLVQVEQTAAVDEYLRAKYTNLDLYDWMADRLSTLHFSAYRLARDLALQAERAAARELGDASIRVIGNGGWDTMRSGLLAGEQLHQEIKRLELTYLERNRREHELVKHVSLRRLDPRALLDFVTQGRCEFELPEWLFDLDFPGHYLRRIKSVSLSLPCVTGPYTSVNCRLTLLRHATRQVATVRPGYDMTEDDERFGVVFAGGESIVTSTGRDDGGLFESNLRDERYLPFEHAGAISRWRLEMPGLGNQFDATTLTDAIVHLRYTARDGGQSFGDAASRALAASWQRGPASGGLATLLSARADFSAEWIRAENAVNEDLVVDVADSAVLPYWMLATRGLKLDADGARAFAIRSTATAPSDTARAVALSPSELSVAPLPAAGTLRVTLKQQGWRDADDVLLLLPVRPKEGSP